MEAKNGENQLFIKKRQYFLGFILRHRLEIGQLREGKIFGLSQESRGWRNVAEHCVLAAVMTHTLGKLAGMSERELTQLTHVALIHDWDKRLSKEKSEKGRETDESGIVHIESDPEKLLKLEEDKHGWLRVTGNDWRDIDSWSLPEKILRYVDSSIGQTGDGKADIVDWRIRVVDLKKRYPEINAKVGADLYNMSLYDRLAEVTDNVEGDIFKTIIEHNPVLNAKYPDQRSLRQLIGDTITSEIETNSGNTQ